MPKDTQKEKKIKAWAVTDCEYHCHFLSENGWPMIYIQKTKPKVYRDKNYQEVIPITITYNATN